MCLLAIGIERKHDVAILSYRSLQATLDEILWFNAALVMHSKSVSPFVSELLASLALGNQTRMLGADALKSEGPGRILHAILSTGGREQ